mgnify:FL=1
MINQTVFNFIRPEITQLLAYSSHPQEIEMPLDADKLDTNESPYDLPPEIKENLAWQYQQLIKSHRYPDGTHEQLKGAIAQYIEETSASFLTTDQISVGNGSDELIRSLLIATCVGTNASILIAEPTFSMYKILAQTLGITTISIPREETNFTIKRGQAEQAIAQATASGHPVKVIFVVHPIPLQATNSRQLRLNGSKTFPKIFSWLLTKPIKKARTEAGLSKKSEKSYAGKLINVP